MDAIVVTNLFGIHNDIDAIKKKCPNLIIIVDNAHGYGLPNEGDYTKFEWICRLKDISQVIYFEIRNRIALIVGKRSYK